MSARQNKKQRKGRNNPNNRERTVTTLTEDPNTPYLVPTPSEEPAGTSLMSSPFSVSSSSAGNIPSSSAYQPPSSYATFGYNTAFGTPVHGPLHHQQPQPQQQAQQFYPQQAQQPHAQLLLPAGRNDLEILENLKEIIKNGQHDMYRPIPNPAALASIYLGPIPTSQVPGVRNGEQDQYGSVVDSPMQASPTTVSPTSPVDLGRRPPRLQSKESWDASAQRKPPPGSTGSGGPPTNNTNQAAQGHGMRYTQGSNPPPAIDTSNLSNGKTNLAGLPSAGTKSVDVHLSGTATVSPAVGPGPSSPRSARFDTNGQRPMSGIVDQARISGDRLGHSESGYGVPQGPGTVSPAKSSFDGKDDLRNARDTAWSTRDGPPPSDDRRRDFDRPPPSPAPRTLVNGNGVASDTRLSAGDRVPPPPRDDRFYDRDRERERERDYRDRRDWDRDRRPPYDRFRGMTDARRPPPEQRHYEPDYDRVPPRRYDVRDELASEARRLSDSRPPPTLTPADERALVRPVDDRLPPASARAAPVSDARPPAQETRLSQPDSRAPLPDSRAPPPDNRPTRGPSFDDRQVKPPPADERRGAPVPANAHAPPPAVRSADAPGVGRPADDRDRARDVPMPSVDDQSTTRPQVPLEDRISRPSLQDRLNQPPASRPEPSNVTRQASLEERLSAIPVSTDPREQRGGIPERDRAPPPRPGPPADVRPGVRAPPPAPSAQDDRRLDDRPGPYRRPPTPTPGDRILPSRRTPSPHPAVRATFPLPVRDDSRVPKPPSPHRPVARDYRRPVSRERPGGSYRPDDRSYVPDDRRGDPMDVDIPSRYSDGRVPYNRPFSPPSAADIARDRARAQLPPSPPRPPAHVDAPPYDDDRRYASGRDWSYHPSYDRRRDWSVADDDYYKRHWDRSGGPPPPSSGSDRDRFDREPPPPMRNGGWETRDERERRDFARAPSPARTAYDGPGRPLGSTYSSAASAVAPGDRSYAPPPPTRDGPPAVFSRVRQRSLSPARRPIDDGRPPPNKRPREDGYAAPDFYPPVAASSARGRQDTYPPLGRGGASPPPSSGGSGYFDRSGPPPSSAGTATSGEREREYPLHREYPPLPPYDRGRSPPRGYARPGGTGYGVRDARDERRYLPPPPPHRLLRCFRLAGGFEDAAWLELLSEHILRLGPTKFLSPPVWIAV
ncbi:hypothetical protein LshimejAT787_1901510 [Lyophyllum shimeji]|uniref:Uncharacterized protein n=1 Tax=Lyophyllum shimeji TaxID=47721 RepID=A0A9P3PZX6_LYOSH|nr:hypothetical protein LshimejAT787_1901510 [Lyophyllum shimeji]